MCTYKTLGFFNRIKISKVYYKNRFIVVLTRNEKQSVSVDRRKGLVERACDAFGLLGAVRFLESYYLLVRLDS